VVQARAPRVREVWTSKPGPAKFYTVLQVSYHRFNMPSTQIAACCSVEANLPHSLRRNIANVMKCTETAVDECVSKMRGSRKK